MPEKHDPGWRAERAGWGPGAGFERKGGILVQGGQQRKWEGTAHFEEVSDRTHGGTEVKEGKRGVKDDPKISLLSDGKTELPFTETG